MSDLTAEEFDWLEDAVAYQLGYDAMASSGISYEIGKRVQSKLTALDSRKNPPCPRCGRPMFPVDIGDGETIFGHDCLP